MLRGQRCQMELVGEDGSIIELKEGQRHELGRGRGPATSDGSVSRLHALVELRRPESRKGKEIVGRSPDLKLLVEVVGRNPICIATRGSEGKNTAQIKFSARGEKDWLTPGDEFSLSIKRPLFFKFLLASLGRVGTGQSSLGTKDVDNPNTQTEANVMKFRSDPRDEEQAIANALARRQRRRLEREEEERRKHHIDHHEERHEEEYLMKSMPSSEDEQQGIANAVARRQRRRLERETGENRRHQTEYQDAQRRRLEISDSQKQTEISVLPCQTNNALYPVDPVSEFGFLVEGSEFRPYETWNNFVMPVWRWKIEKARDSDGEDSEKDTAEKVEKNNRISVRKPVSSVGKVKDRGWEGDNKVEQGRIAGVMNLNRNKKMSERATRSKILAQKKEGQQASHTEHLKRAGAELQDGEDVTGFVVKDDESIEEESGNGEESDDDDDDVNDDDDDDEDDDDLEGEEEEGLITGKRHTKGSSQKPACKYGKNCYRKNPKHLSQFYHPKL